MPGGIDPGIQHRKSGCKFVGSIHVQRTECLHYGLQFLGTSIAIRVAGEVTVEIQIALSIAAGAVLLLAVWRRSIKRTRSFDVVPVSDQWLSEQKRHLEW